MKVSVKQAKSALGKMMDGVRRDLRRAERESIRQAKEIAVIQSSGPVKADELAAMGHPYARRHFGQPSHAHKTLGQPSYVINIQSGEFVKNWKTTLPSSGSKIVTILYNNTWYAKFFPEGSSKMIPRPIEAAITSMIEIPRLRRIQAVLDKWF